MKNTKIKTKTKSKQTNKKKNQKKLRVLIFAGVHFHVIKFRAQSKIHEIHQS